jgi:hypothetical protein
VAISQFPLSAGGDPSSYNKAYTTELSGAVPVDIAPGVYNVTVTSSGNIALGTNTLINNSTGTYFVTTPQTSMTIAPLGASGVVPWSGATGGYGYESAQEYTTRPIIFGNDLYIIAIYRNTGRFNFAPQIRVSTTGTGNWAHPLNATNNASVYGGAYGAGRYVFGVVGGDLGGELWSSTNAYHWERPFSGLNYYFVRFLNNRFLAGGDSGVLRTSTDGLTWSIPIAAADTAFQDRSMRCAAFGNGVYVVAGGEGQLITSTDTVTWTTRNSNAVGNWLEAAAFGNGTFVVAGNGQLRTSTDGVTWAVRTFGNQEPIFEIIFQAGIFIAAGRYSVQTSVDGATWTLRTNPATYQSNNDYHAYGLIFGNNRYLMGGMNYQSNTGYHHAILWNTTTFGGAASAQTRVLFEKKSEISAIV